MTDTCKDCRFWKDGKCKRLPPQVIFRPGGSGGGVGYYGSAESVWPETRSNDWCGEHQPPLVRVDGNTEAPAIKAPPTAFEGRLARLSQKERKIILEQDNPNPEDIGKVCTINLATGGFYTYFTNPSAFLHGLGISADGLRAREIIAAQHGACEDFDCKIDMPDECPMVPF